VVSPFSLPENFVRDSPLLRQSKSVRIKWAAVESLVPGTAQGFFKRMLFSTGDGWIQAGRLKWRRITKMVPEPVCRADGNSGKDTAMGRTSPIRVTLLRGLSLVILLAVLAGCKRSPGPTPDGTVTPTSDVLSGKVTILLQDNEFHPQKLTIRAGTTVSWINKDPQFRTVRSDDGLFQSSALAIGQMFSFTFDEPGTYAYYCEPGGGSGGEGMSGVITVVA
jgi:plastocyanin